MTAGPVRAFRGTAAAVPLRADPDGHDGHGFVEFRMSRAGIASMSQLTGRSGLFAMQVPRDADADQSSHLSGSEKADGGTRMALLEVET